MKYIDHCLTLNLFSCEVLVDHKNPLKNPHIYINTQHVHTFKHTLILQNIYIYIYIYKVCQCSVRRQITQSARHGWESTIKCCSEYKLSHDSLQWKDGSRDQTGREGCHIGQRLWNYLGWHSLAFPCKILPQGAMRRLIIDVNTDKRMLMSSVPHSNFKSTHYFPATIRERAGEKIS